MDTERLFYAWGITTKNVRSLVVIHLAFEEVDKQDTQVKFEVNFKLKVDQYLEVITGIS